MYMIGQRCVNTSYPRGVILPKVRICMTSDLHLYRDAHHLWLLRGLAYLPFGYDPLGVFSGEQTDAYGFVQVRRVLAVQGFPYRKTLLKSHAVA